MSVFRFALYAIIDAVMRSTSDHRAEATNKFNVVSTPRENLPILLAGSLARATSEKAFIQSDTYAASQRDDTKLVDKHADSVILSVIAGPHSPAKEMLDARRNATGTLVVSSEQHDKTSEHNQISMDVKGTRVSITKTSWVCFMFLVMEAHRCFSDETVNSSYKSDGGSHNGHLNENIEGKRANTNLYAACLVSTCDDQSRLTSVTNSDGILHQSAREQSLDLTAVEEVEEDQHVTGAQVHISLVLDPGFTSVEQSTASAQHIEKDAAQLATSLEVSAATEGTLLTSVATVDHSYDAGRFVMKHSPCLPALISCQC